MTARLLVVNADFNAGHNNDLIDQCCEWCDVLALVEAKDFILADLLPKGWRSLQATSDDAHKGSCLAVREEKVIVKESYLVHGCNEPKGGGMLKRYIACAELQIDGWQMVAMAAHYPPGRYQDECGPEMTNSLQAAWAHNKTRHPTLGCDANMPIKDMAKKLSNAKGYGVEVMGWCVNDNIKVSDTTKRGGVETEGWSDHPGFQVNVETG